MTAKDEIKTTAVLDEKPTEQALPIKVEKKKKKATVERSKFSITVMTETLLEALSRVGHTVQKSETGSFDTWRHVMIVTEGKNKVRLSTYIPDIGASSTKIGANIIEQGAVNISYTMFQTMLKHVHVDQVQLVVDPDAGELEIRDANSQFVLYKCVTQDLDYSSMLTQQKSEKVVRIDRDAFTSLIDRVKNCYAKDAARPTLQCVNFNFDTHEVKVAATDGFRLVTTSVAVSTDHKYKGLNLMGHALTKAGSIYSKSVENILTIYLPTKDEDGREKTPFIIDDNTTQFAMFGIGDMFPDYLPIIPKEDMLTMTIVTTVADLKKGLKAVDVIAAGGTSMALLEANSQNTSLTMSAHVPALGMSEVSVPVSEVKGKASRKPKGEMTAVLIIALNARYLIHSVAGFKDDEEVIIQAHTSNTPIVIKMKNLKDSYLYVQMPMATK